jgi:hypothetical protein
MAMGWLKGLVAPAAFPDNNPQGQQQPGMPPMGGPPMGGGPSPYGAQPGMQPGMMPPQGGPAPYDASGLNSPMQWSTGTKTQGGAQGGISQGAVAPPGAANVAAAPAGSLEARCVQLQHDVDSLALFARTLLTMLEEAKVVTREQFDATKQRLDMLDGKLDDR